MTLSQYIVPVYYTKLEAQLSSQRWEALMTRIPKQLQEKVMRFRFWEDRHRALFGKLLLLKALEEHGFSGQLLETLSYSKFGRPGISETVDFNISHSGNYVLCAFGKGTRLGVDVEEIKDIDLADFTITMTPGQWKWIHHQEKKLHAFFTLWTLKESVIKANGKGLSIPLDQLETDFKTIKVEGDVWYLKPLDLDNKHCGYIACDKPDGVPRLQEVHFF